MGPDGIHPWVLRELADITARHSWSTLKGSGDQQRCLRTGRKQSQPRITGQPASPQSLERWWSTLFWKPSLCTWMTWTWSGIVSMDSPKVNQAWTNLITFYDEATAWMGEGGAVDTVDFSKVFDTVSCEILTGKLKKSTLDEQIDNWLNNSFWDSWSAFSFHRDGKGWAWSNRYTTKLSAPTSEVPAYLCFSIAHHQHITPPKGTHPTTCLHCGPIKSDTWSR